MSANLEKEINKKLIERLHKEVKAEIRRRSQLQAEAANKDLPFKSQRIETPFFRRQRRNTSRDAPFNTVNQKTCAVGWVY